MNLNHHRALTLVALLALATAACQQPAGADGAVGPQGPTGDKGPAGDGGVPVGSIAGTLTYSPDGTQANTYPATGVTVTLSPDVGLSATSGADGAFTLAGVPVGIYVVKFSGNGFVDDQLANVSVVSGKPAAASKVLKATLPFAAVAAAGTPNPAGFGQSVPVGVTILVGGQPVTAPDANGYTFTWSVRKAPLPVTLPADALAGKPTFQFTTDTLAALAASPKVTGLTIPARAALVGVTYQQVLDTTYQLDCAVTGPKGFSTKVTVAVSPATVTAGNANMAPRGVMLIASSGSADTGAWTLTPPPAIPNDPNDVVPTLIDGSGDHPTFVPTRLGTYTLTRGTGTSLTINVGKYVGSQIAYDTNGNVTQPSCAGGATGCHATLAPSIQDNVVEKFTEYAASPHGSVDITADGLDGKEGPYFSAECLRCHTTGNNPVADAVNGGFDDVAKAVGWTFPTKLQPGNYDAMPDALKQLNKVQCESCHGPMGAHETLVFTPGTVRPRAEWSAQTCGQCHDDLPYADKFQLWSQSGHADPELTAEATVEDRGTTAAHCGRCHAAQGFATYAAQQQAGDPGQLARPADLVPAPAVCTPASFPPAGPIDPNCPCTPAAGKTTCTGDPAFYAYLSNLGLNRAEVHEQTCQTCHDPHTTKLRVDGDSGPLAAGFSVGGAGAGALCMVCHNTRNGLHGDAVAVKDLTSGPHTPSQTDVYAGQNAYFTTGGLSMHGAVADTCVGCHVNLHPAGIKVANTNHTFKADTTICANCHSSNVTGEGTEASFVGARQAVLAQMLADLNAAIGGSPFQVLPQDPVTENAAAAPITISQVPSALELRTIHGQTSLILTLPVAIADPFNAGGTTTTIVSKLPDIKDATGAFAYIAVKVNTATTDPAALPFAKATWNTLLVTDGSGSIHNPTFVQKVLQATQAKLAAVKPAAACGATCL